MKQNKTKTKQKWKRDSIGQKQKTLWSIKLKSEKTHVHNDPIRVTIKQRMNVSIIINVLHEICELMCILCLFFSKEKFCCLHCHYFAYFIYFFFMHISIHSRINCSDALLYWCISFACFEYTTNQKHASKVKVLIQSFFFVCFTQPTRS